MASSKVVLKVVRDTNPPSDKYVAPVVVNGSTIDLPVAMTSSKIVVDCGSLKGETCPSSVFSCGSPWMGVSATTETTESGIICKGEREADVQIGNVQLSASTLTVLYNTFSLSGSSSTKGRPTPEFGINQNSAFAKRNGRFALSLRKGDLHLKTDGVDESVSTSSELTAMELRLASSSDWSVRAAAIQFGKSKAENACEDSDGDSCQAKFSMQDPLIRLHSDDFSAFEKMISGHCSGKDSQLGGFRCPDKSQTKLPRITIALDDKLFTLDPTDYTEPSEASGYISVLIGSTSSRTWALGQPFLKKYYTMFDATNKAITVYCRGGVDCGAGSLSTALKPVYSSPSTDSNFDDSSDDRVPAKLIYFIIAILIFCFGLVVKFFSRFSKKSSSCPNQEEPTVCESVNPSKTTNPATPEVPYWSQPAAPLRPGLENDKGPSAS
ncbi:hypothetical protein P43SY_004337 [Pythium insidiosum]|uniref:Peptidase A1 domain-containing protein n=1 Tax=Pythium insidiosum TaxID=114742 RepID=A0AAD5Q5H3_PYTIN|nr:hypothetical protein P43SY_004337 [Pythium insidiosum]